jgi:hypothetical protein
MMDEMNDEKSMKLKSIMDLIKQMKSMESDDLPGKPKMAHMEVDAVKVPGKPVEMSMGDEGDEESEDMEKEPSEMQIPPELLKMLKEKLSSKI